MSERKLNLHHRHHYHLLSLIAIIFFFVFIQFISFMFIPVSFVDSATSSYHHRFGQLLLRFLTYIFNLTCVGLNNSVGIATGYGLDGCDSIPGRARDLSLLHIVQTGSGFTQPPIQWASGAISSGIKQLGREADHSPPPIEEVKNGGAIQSHTHLSSWRDT
jgi:hypothetical protein